MSEATTTNDHETIRQWAEERNGRPARVETSEPGGILRIDFGEPEEGLEEISWKAFFEIFEQNALSFLHQDETDDGGKSRFNKFVRRDS